MKNKIAIIGGGASGLVAAIMIARCGGDVTIFESQNILGKKILATGNGRCNLTNLNMNQDAYYCDREDYIATLLQKYPLSEVLDFFQSIGVSTIDKGGYVYPSTEQASTIRNALQYEIEHLNIRYKIDTMISNIRPLDHSGFSLSWENESEDFDRAIVTCGSKSGIHNINMYTTNLLTATKHTINKLSPALVSLQGRGKVFSKLSGTRIHGSVTMVVEEKMVARHEGELQFIKTGISGIPVFQISRIASQALLYHIACYALIDFSPEYTLSELEERLMNRKQLFSGRRVREFANGLWKDKVVDLLLYLARIDEEECISDVDAGRLKKLSRIAKTFKVEIQGVDSFEKSQVTAGGISLNEISEWNESIYHKGLYFAGEILDIDGICGGYNLHHAWVSGMHVGIHAIEETIASKKH